MAVVARVAVSVLSLAIAGALAATAHAQAPEADAEDKPVQLEAVQVTAQRRVENIQDVPMAISSLAAEKLDAMTAGGEDIRFLAARLPSLQIESSFGRAFPRFYIRGLGNTDFDLNASQPVSLVYDDVVQENPILKGFPVFDVEQIEMARGPQGTLFGRNSPAGVVKFNSVRPFGETDGYVRAGWGQRQTMNLEGAVGGALGDGIAARISLLHQRRDDWVDNIDNGPGDDLEGYRESAGRFQLLFSGREGFEALANLHARSLDGTARLFRAGAIVPGTNDFVPGFRRDQVSFDGGNEQELDGLGGSLRLRWDFDRYSLYSITGYESVEIYSRGDIDGGSFYGFPPDQLHEALFPAESADGLPVHAQWSQELRIESREWGRFDWQAGLYWFDEELEVDSFSFDTLGGGGINGRAWQRQENTAWAVFASMDFDVSDRFKLRGGLRYTHDSKDFVAERSLSPFGAGPLGPLTANPSDSHVSWDISGVWQLNDHANVYARIAEGFRAPSIQGRILFGDTISMAETETVVSFETGIKGDFFDNRLRLGLGVFAYTLQDQQLTAVGGDLNLNRLINANEVRGRGIELDLEAYVTDRLLVTGGFSYNHTEIDDPGLSVPVCFNCTVLDPIDPDTGFALLDGNPLPHAPRTIANFTARYGVPMGESGELYVYTDWAYRSEINLFLYESIEFEGGSLLEGGLRVAYAWQYGDYEVAVFGRNITDELALIGGIDFNNLTAMTNEPRLWGVEFRAKF